MAEPLNIADSNNSVDIPKPQCIAVGRSLQDDLSTFHGPIVKVATEVLKMGQTFIKVFFENGQYTGAQMDCAILAVHAYNHVLEYIKKHGSVDRLDSFEIAFGEERYTRETVLSELALDRSDTPGWDSNVENFSTKDGNFAVDLSPLALEEVKARQNVNDDKRKKAQRELTGRLFDLSERDIDEFLRHVRAFQPKRITKARLEAMRLHDRWEALKQHYGEDLQNQWKTVRSDQPTVDELKDWIQKRFPDRVELGLVFGDLRQLDNAAYRKITNWDVDPAEFGFPIKRFDPDLPVPTASDVFQAFRDGDPAARKIDRQYKRARYHTMRK